jgi:predicted NBD/HSP70 family sugar kinase
MVYITVGTGVGSGIVIDGRLHRGVALSTSEVGHHVIDMNGPPCYCGARGCLEMFVAAPAIVQRARAVWADALGLRRACADDPAQITSKRVYEAAQQGDVAAARVMDDTGRYLGIGLANVLNILGPEALVLGGGVMQGWDLIAPPMFDAIYSRDAMVPFKRIKITRAALGLNAGITGAARAIFDAGLTAP